MKTQKETWRTWFTKLILNNRVVVNLLIVLLCLSIIWVFSKVTWFFQPISDFADIVALPIVLAGVLFYLFNPLVDRLEKKYHVNRVWTISGLFVVVVLLLAWGIIALIPVIRNQASDFLENWPAYWNHLVDQVEAWLNDPRLGQFQKEFDQISKSTTNSFSKWASSFANQTFSSVSGVISSITKIVVGIITMPFILFYLLKDGHQLPKYLAHFLPIEKRSGFLNTLGEINGKLSGYIRGQLIVAFCVAVMFFVGYAIIGLKFALTLGITAGVLNLIPYLGSFLAMVPSVVLAAFISPWMLVKVLIVFAIEQTIEGRLISPLILGTNLGIHPVTILIVLLASGRMFGVLGVIFGIPVYAVSKVILTHLFRWYKRQNGGYE
ncbi:AI-2E family transporter [Pediococcus siamensis]|uniref:AI-2E family transporter n=1 Tax=Pediococcus siamensis TaxID=381829 RepID=UPI0039A10D77